MVGGIFSASLREIDLQDRVAVEDFFVRESREAVAAREGWETEYAIENQTLFGVFLEDSNELIATSGIFVYPHVDETDWTRKSPSTLSSSDIEGGCDPRAYELGGTLVARGYEGFGLQLVLIATRMCHIRYYMLGSDGDCSHQGLASDLTMIAVKNDEDGLKSRRNINRMGFHDTSVTGKEVPTDLLYPCLSECLNNGIFRRDGICRCYNFYSADFEDYLAKSWEFQLRDHWYLTRSSRYQSSDGRLKQVAENRMSVKNDTKLRHNLLEVYPIDNG